MIVIETVSTTKFSIDGIEYYKNFMPIVRGNTIAIINVYDSKVDLSGAKEFDVFSINGVVYGNIEDTQSALLPVLFSRDAGGVGGFIWGEGTGTLTDQTDLVNYIEGEIDDRLPLTTKQIFIATDNQTVFTLSPPSDNFIAFMGRNLAIEGIDYTYDAPDITFTTGQIANTRITVLKLS